MSLLDGLQLIITALIAIWGIYQTKVTKQLEQNIQRLNIGLDQTIQLLHRAREAVIKIHSAHVFLLGLKENKSENIELQATRYAEMSAHQAELRGLAFAIKDKELLEIVNQSYHFMRQPFQERNIVNDEIEIRGRSQELHTRISQLIEITTKGNLNINS